MIDHVIGRCNFLESATVTSTNGITTNLYGLWIKAENPGTLLFINSEEKADEGSRRLNLEKNLVPVVAQILKLNALDERLQGCLTETACLVLNPENQAKEDPIKDYLTALEMNLKLKALELTLNRQQMGTEIKLQTAVINHLKDPNFSQVALSKWATEIIQFIASYHEQECTNQEAPNSSFIMNGLGLASHSSPSGFRTVADNISSPNRKRAGPSWLSGSARKPVLRIEEIQETQPLKEPVQETPNTDNEIQTQEGESNGDNFQTTPSINYSIEEEESEERIRTRSWKRKARRSRRSS